MRKKITGTVCVLLAALLLPGLRAGAVTQPEIDALEEERDKIEARQADLQEQIDALRTERAAVAERKAALDEQTALHVRDIALLDRQIALYARMAEDKEIEAARALAAEELQLAHYKARVRAMEETNPWACLSILLKATSLTDFLSRLADVSDVLRRDRNAKAEYEAARARAEQAKAEYEELRERQTEARETLLTEQSRLERQLEQSETVIRQLEDDIEAYTAAYDENEAEQANIRARIDEMAAELRAREEAERKAREAALAARREQQEAEKAAEAAAAAETAANAAPHVWPCPSSSYISSSFGYHVNPIFGSYKYHAGVDIAAPYGSDVVAAASGTVGISEYSPSYGYYCVIYHADGVATLYAHMDAPPLAAAGGTVSAGQIIGHTGSTGWAAGPGLRFEIRVGGNCVDPLAYFPDISFTFAPDG